MIISPSPMNLFRNPPCNRITSSIAVMYWFSHISTSAGGLPALNGREAADVRKHHGRDALLTVQRDLVAPVPDRARNERIDVTREERHQLHPLVARLLRQNPLGEELHEECDGQRDRQPHLLPEERHPEPDLVK